MRFSVHVVPGASKPGPAGRYGGLPRLRVRSRATDGRANAEAQRVLTELLAVKVELATGAHSRRKTFVANLEQGVADARLREVFGD